MGIKVTVREGLRVAGQPNQTCWFIETMIERDSHTGWLPNRRTRTVACFYDESYAQWFAELLRMRLAMGGGDAQT